MTMEILPAKTAYSPAAPPVCITDWRNPAGWSAIEKQRKADVWSLYWTATQENTAGLVGEKLIAFQPGLPWSPGGVMTSHPYAQDLLSVVDRFKARTGLKLYEGPDGGFLELIDLTKRGLVPAIAAIWLDHFGWAGFHGDYWINPASFFPRGTFTDEYLSRFDRSLNAFASILREDEPGRTLIGQNDRMLGDTWGAMSGCYIEQSLWFNGRTPAEHASDLESLSTLMRMVDPSRRLVSVLEIRKPWTFIDEQLSTMRAWAAARGVCISVGRDATAVGKLAA